MRFNPLAPTLPRYPGPFQVGSVEIELPLPEDLQKTFGTCTVKTLLVRLFYPTSATAGRKPRWTGHGHYTIQGYAKFLGIRESLLGAASYLGLKWTEIPAFSDAPLLSRSSGRWPCMLFSHGLGGTRNAYSQICGSIASGGVCVMAVEHRDNSAAISVVGTEIGEEIVDYVSVKESTTENVQKRRHQMAQRAYEMRLGLELFRSLETQSPASLFKVSDHDVLKDFAKSLDTQPGNVIIGGHSFGAATSVHCCKDSETTRLSSDPSNYSFQKEFRASVLLDLWTEVLVDSNSRPLKIPTLCIASEAFQKWSSNFTAVKSLMKPTDEATRLNKLCWIKQSAHLSQSDFQLLFPTATKFAFKAAIDPHHCMQLNLRAIREFLRQLGIGEEPVDDKIFTNEDDLVVTEL